MISRWKIYKKYQNKKELRNTIKFYNNFLNNFGSEEYIKYEKNMQKYAVKGRLSKNQKQLLESNSKIYAVKLFDTLNNKEFSKLIKKINKLNNKDYSVDLRYKNPTFFKKYSFIGIQFKTASYGSLADIKFKNDAFFEKVEIVWSPLDSFRAFIEYTFFFKVALSNQNDMLNFLKHKLRYINASDYVPKFYGNNDKNRTFSNYNWIYKNGLTLICQNFITSNLYSRNGMDGEL